MRSARVLERAGVGRDCAGSPEQAQQQQGAEGDGQEAVVRCDGRRQRLHPQPLALMLMRQAQLEAGDHSQRQGESGQQSTEMGPVVDAQDAPRQIGGEADGEIQ